MSPSIRIYRSTLLTGSVFAELSCSNFDNSLQRLKSWTIAASPYSTPGSPTTSTAALATMGLSLTAASPPLTPDPSGSALSSAQRKRVKTFLKRARQNPRHTQLNLESYLLLPVQRIPRYRMLVSLAQCHLSSFNLH